MKVLYKNLCLSPFLKRIDMLRSDMIGCLKYGTTRRGTHLPDSENRLQKQGSSDKIKMENYKFPRNEVCAMPVLSVFFGIIVLCITSKATSIICRTFKLNTLEKKLS